MSDKNDARLKWVNVHVDVCSWKKESKLDVLLYLQAYFVHASSKGSGESAGSHTLANIMY